MLLNHTYAGIEITTWIAGIPTNASSLSFALRRNGVLEEDIDITAESLGAGHYLASFTTLGEDENWSELDSISLRCTAVLNGQDYPAVVFSTEAIASPPENPTVIVKLPAYYGFLQKFVTTSKEMELKVGQVSELSIDVRYANGDAVQDIVALGYSSIIIVISGDSYSQVVQSEEMTIDGSELKFINNSDATASAGDRPYIIWGIGGPAGIGGKTPIVEGKFVVVQGPPVPEP